MLNGGSGHGARGPSAARSREWEPPCGTIRYRDMTKAKSLGTRIVAAALLALFTTFMLREAVLGGCAVDRAVPTGHAPVSAPNLFVTKVM